jgi:hypothetical protein
MALPILRNPALAELEILVGDWDAETVFPNDPPGTLQGRVSFEWLEEGAFLLMRSEIQGEGPPRSLAVIGRDDASGAYSFVYYDVRGVSRVYAMRFGGGEWALEGKPRDFFQRFRGRVAPDGRTIEGTWEKSDDGQSWDHDFALTYRKIAG